MPEGDSLHRIAAMLAPLVGETIEVLALPRKNVAKGAYAGRRIEHVEARGKNLLVRLEGGVTLKTHLKMNGAWRLSPRGPVERALRSPDTVVVLATAAHLAICTGAPVAELVRTADIDRAPDAQIRGGLGELGPDVLAAGFDAASAALRWQRASQPTIAEALLDQRLAAGIGNEWKSELCFVVELDPRRAPATVPLATLTRLAEEAAARMRFNVERRPRLYPIDRVKSGAGRIARTERTAREGPRSVYERGGLACYRCGARIERIVHGAPPRSTYFCPGCQR